MQYYSRAFILLTLFISNVSSALALQISEPYKSGEELCADDNNLSKEEKAFGFYLDVPIDYANPKLGNTKIYAWTTKAFDPSRESFLYFVGGPGGSAHGDTEPDKLAPHFNAIYLDQRGIACSRPSDKNLLLDQRYFSSESTARDANEVRKHLGISKWSIYGHSYGTIPATIAANLFPDTINGVILEGVVFDGAVNLWSAPHRIKILQRYFDHLPPELQEKILSYSNRADLVEQKHWFSSIAQKKMYENFPMQALAEELERLFKLDDATLTMQLKIDSSTHFPSMDYELYFGSFSYAQIVCKELSGQDPHSNMWAVFDGKKLISMENQWLNSICTELGTKSEATRTYSSLNYPITVPVTYFEGSLDGATEAPSAIRHYKKVAKGSAQLILAPQGGHHPTGQSFKDPNFMSTIFEMGLRGQAIPHDIIKAEAASDPFKLVITSKGF
jgi:proline iminopeptidase